MQLKFLVQLIELDVRQQWFQDSSYAQDYFEHLNHHQHLESVLSA
jgi:hypothetical protein